MSAADFARHRCGSRFDSANGDRRQGRGDLLAGDRFVFDSFAAVSVVFVGRLDLFQQVTPDSFFDAFQGFGV